MKETTHTQVIENITKFKIFFRNENDSVIDAS